MIRYNVLTKDCKPRQNEGDAGMDLRLRSGMMIRPGEIIMIPLGVSFQIPVGQFIGVSARSSIALKGIYCHVGTIDATFNGKEVCGIFANVGKKVQYFPRGERVVQAIGFKHEPLTMTTTPIDSGVSKDGFGSSGRM